MDRMNYFTGSYGSTLRYKSVERLKPIGKHSLLGASGEISDFQEIMRYLDELMWVVFLNNTINFTKMHWLLQISEAKDTFCVFYPWL